jgi:acyl carrier protein
MSNLQRYQEAFINTFGVTEIELVSLAYQAIPAWDSVGHMELMTVLEDSFGIQLDIDDIIDFSSYEKGKLILQKNGVQIDFS